MAILVSLYPTNLAQVSGDASSTSGFISISTYAVKLLSQVGRAAVQLYYLQGLVRVRTTRTTVIHERVGLNGLHRNEPNFFNVILSLICVCLSVRMPLRCLIPLLVHLYVLGVCVFVWGEVRDSFII